MHRCLGVAVPANALTRVMTHEVQPSRQNLNVISLFLCGDVMTGRGIDQVLAHPVNPLLYEPYVRDAREYVELAETAHGPIPSPVSFEYIWGDALAEFEQAGTDSRIINLETSVTTSEEARAKGINYRMHPANIRCITAARIDCCCLANNHILDWGYLGLNETIAALDQAHLAHAGAGRNLSEAAAPVVLNLGERGRILIFALGSPTSGISLDWAASANRPGLNLIEILSEETAHRVACEIQKPRQLGDIVVVSIHWGGNWGYEVPTTQTQFAHRLIDEGIDLVHGHSSHHAKAIEVYKDRLILYGCGDFLNDYEGITGYEEYRGDLSVMYLPKLEPVSGRLVELKMTVLQSRRFRLSRAPASDVHWLHNVLNNICAPHGARVEMEQDECMKLHW
jgi:poly-gamma-glutamate capsule biosynthesis protein CapA/YwtB (metallophosphatase superfamily)